MPFTKQEIIDMPPGVVDEYVLEQVFQYKLVHELKIGQGTDLQEAWVDPLGSGTFPWVRLDGSSPLAPVPGYIVWPRATPPKTDTPEWFVKIVARAGGLNFRLDVFLQAGVWSAAIVPVASGAPPASAIVTSMVSMEDATRRAALLAVQ